jgi:uncharacterized membrane protein
MADNQTDTSGQRSGGTVKFGDTRAPQNRGSGGPPSGNSGGFDLNRPTIISLTYLGGFITGISPLIGIVLAHVWNGEGVGGDNEAWMQSHYTYHIRTFWIGLLASIVSAVLMLVLIGFLMIFAVSIWMLVRTVMAMLKAQKQEPMPDPETLLF